MFKSLEDNLIPIGFGVGAALVLGILLYIMIP